MALTEQKVVDRIEVLETGHLNVQWATYVVDDDSGDRVSGPAYSRQAFAPGADIEDQDQEIKDIAAVAWTDDRIEAEEAAHALRYPHSER
tara:strand:- start:303 stop:572 length:270 start_codon:yes stop_codon:yes gene_type:complete